MSEKSEKKNKKPLVTFTVKNSKKDEIPTDTGKHRKYTTSRVSVGAYIAVVLIVTYCAYSWALQSFPEYRGVVSFQSPPFLDVIKGLNPFWMFAQTPGYYALLATFVVFIIVAALTIGIYSSGRKLVYDSSFEEISQGAAKWLLDCTMPASPDADRSKLVAKEKAIVNFKNKMMEKNSLGNIMFNTEFGISMNTSKTFLNLHALVIGGSGAGKTRYFVKPNILQMNSSYIVTDPSGELYRDMGSMLQDNGYDVRVFNVADIQYSMQYNPLKYLRKPEDVIELVTAFIQNTGEAKGDNKFFDDATKLLLNAIILFLFLHCPEEERDFAHVIKLVVAANVNEDAKGKDAKSTLDYIFEQVEAIDPNDLSLKMYKSFQATSGKTLKSVLASTATRMTVFNYPAVEKLTCDDTISLDTIGDEKTALFIITPPLDNGYEFLVAMMYTQLFTRLYDHFQFDCRYLLTDNYCIARPFVEEEDAQHIKNLIDNPKDSQGRELIEYIEDETIVGKNKRYDMYELIYPEKSDFDDGNTETETKGIEKKLLLKRLRPETVDTFKNNPKKFIVKQNTKAMAGAPFHVRMLMDEFANINEIPGFVRILSTIRKYNASIVIILQALSQLKKIYEKDYEAVIGNCDTMVFLGGNDGDTMKYISEKLGFQTIFTMNHSKNGGKGGVGDSTSAQKRELVTQEELGRQPHDVQIVMVRGVCPMRIPKYKLECHPNFKLCADGDGSQLNLKREVNLLDRYPELGTNAFEEAKGSSKVAVQKPLQVWEDAAVNGGDGKPVAGNESDDWRF